MDNTDQQRIKSNTPASKPSYLDQQQSDKVPPLIIPESQGDLADQAQEQIDRDIMEKIIQIRRKVGQYDFRH